MWWRSPRGIGMRLCAVMALAGLTAGCFQPLFATRSGNGGTPLGQALSQVPIERIAVPNGTPEARIAVEIQNALDFELTGGGGMISPTHRLNIRMSTSRSSITTDVNTGLVLSEITGIDTSFTLTDLATGKTVLNRRTFSHVSSDYPGQQQRFA